MATCKKHRFTDKHLVYMTKLVDRELQSVANSDQDGKVDVLKDLFDLKAAVERISGHEQQL